MNDINPPEEAQPLDVNGAAPAQAPAVAAAEAKAQENWNSYLRAVAELENFRKRTERYSSRRSFFCSWSGGRAWWMLRTRFRATMVTTYSGR